MHRGPDGSSGGGSSDDGTLPQDDQELFTTGGGGCCGPRASVAALVALSCLVVALRAVLAGTLTSIEGEYAIGTTTLGAIACAYDLGHVAAAWPVWVHLREHVPWSVGTTAVLFCAATVGYGCGGSAAVFAAAHLLMGVLGAPLCVLQSACVRGACAADATHGTDPWGRALCVVPGALAAAGGLALSGATLHGCRGAHSGVGCPSTTQAPSGGGASLALGCSSWKLPLFYLAAAAAVFAGWLALSGGGSGRQMAAAIASINTGEPPPPPPPQPPRLRAVLSQLAAGPFAALVVVQGAYWFAVSATLAFLPRYLERALCRDVEAANHITAGVVFAASLAPCAAEAVRPSSGGGTTGWMWAQLIVTRALAGSAFVWGFLVPGDLTVGTIVGLAIAYFLLFFPVVGAVPRLAEACCRRRSARPQARLLLGVSSRLLGAVPGPLVLGALLEEGSGLSDRGAYTWVAGPACAAGTVAAVVGLLSSLAAEKTADGGADGAAAAETATVGVGASTATVASAEAPMPMPPSPSPSPSPIRNPLSRDASFGALVPAA